MRRVFFPLLILALLLTACGGGTANLTPVTPPNATAVQQTGNAKVDSILSSWRESVPGELTQRAIKAESIQQNVYTSNSSLQDVKTYYDTNFNNKDGWTIATRSPGLDATQGVLVSGYEHGTTSLVVGAIDATKFGGEGVVVYTATGNK